MGELVGEIEHSSSTTKREIHNSFGAETLLFGA